MESKSSENRDHVLHDPVPREHRERQPSLQRGRAEENERCVSYVLLFILEDSVVKLEALEMRKESNEIDDLLRRTSRPSESKELKGGREVSKAPSKIWHKFVYLEVIYPKFSEVLERVKVAHVVSAQSFGSERGIATPHANPKSFDEWAEVQLVHFFERLGPPVIFVSRGYGIVICCEGVVKVREGSDVPWATSQGAR